MKSIIGVIRVPAIKILCASSEWRKFYSYPETTKKDWAGITELRGSTPIGVIRNSGTVRMSLQDEMEFGAKDLIVQTSHCLKLARNLSFYQFLSDKAVEEARAYSKFGIRHLVLDFSASEDYYDFSEPVVYWLARALAETFKTACGKDFTVGIKMTSGIWAVDLACRFGYDFVLTDDSMGRLRLTEERNRLTDGTDKKKPRVYENVYVYDINDKYKDIDDFCPEGCLVHGDNEDALDAFGKKLSSIAKIGAPKVPVIGFYMDEIMRGEQHYDMTHWGIRDYIMIDMEVRENNYKCKSINERQLQNITDIISKLR